MSVPTSKIENLKGQLRSLQNQRSVPAKQIASVVGKIISMSIVLGLSFEDTPPNNIIISSGDTQSDL